jgi:cysteinyl-tRNA synthetase
MGDAPKDIQELAAERDALRAVRDFAGADAIRDRINAAGWSVVDGPDGWRLEPVAASEPEPEPADVSIHWVVEGWPDDVRRAIASFRANAGARDVRYVVADVTGEDPASFGDDVEVLTLERGTGWAAARNAGLERLRGRIVLLMDGSIEATGDVFGPLEAALADPSIGVCGPFGIVTADLREFEPTEGPECDAIEGYCMAFRRRVLVEVGGFDERFTWYRTAGIDWSFRVNDAGYRCEVVTAPVVKHEHRMWFETPPAERAKWSKRNFYRFLDRWRDRWDLVLSGEPGTRSG